MYGQIGKLPIAYDKQEPYYRRWSNIDIQMIEKLSGEIRIVEERDQEEVKEAVWGLIEKYKRIFFLGFGYAEENLRAIGFPGKVNEAWQIYGTAKGMTQKEIREVKRSLAKNFESKTFMRLTQISSLD